MRFLVFAASHRAASLNRRLAALTAGQVRAAGHDVDFVEYPALDMPPYNDELCIAQGAAATANPFAAHAGRADGIIISTPEYNWSYPGTLKNIIDWTSCLNPNPLAGKTVLLMSATPGPRGGIMGISHLRAPFEALKAFVFPRAFMLGMADRQLEEGKLKEPRQQQLLAAMIADYLEFTQKLHG